MSRSTTREELASRRSPEVLCEGIFPFHTIVVKKKSIFPYFVELEANQSPIFCFQFHN